MKANEFVKEFGWGEAIHIVDYCVEDQVSVYNLCGGLYSDTSVSLYKLKRLVESYELVEERGGLHMVRADVLFLDNYETSSPYWVRMIKAIADVESCQ